MKRILLCTDGSIFAQSIYQYGAWFANRLEAKINVLIVTDLRDKSIPNSTNLSGSIGVNASDVLLDRLVSLEREKAKLINQKAKLILQNAETVLTDLGVAEVKRLHKTGFLVDFIPELETQTDLIVIGKRGEGAEFASGHLGSNLERIVRSSKKPCLVTSRRYKPIQRLLLAYDGSTIGQKLLVFLAESPVFKGLELHIVSVAKNTSDPNAQARLSEAEQQAHEFAPICKILNGDPEKVITQYSQENNIDLLLIGAYGHSRIRHLVIGSTTAQILRSSDIPVLVYR